MKTLEFWDLVHLLRRAALTAAQRRARSAPEREAAQFAYLLERLPIGFAPGESLAGDFGCEFLGVEELEEFTGQSAECQAPVAPDTPPQADPFALLDQHFNCRAGYTLAHTCADYQTVIERGLAGLLEDVGDRLARATGEQADTLRGRATALGAVARWAMRYAVLAREAAAHADDPAERQRLTRIAQTCQRVPLQPATTFHEAVQSVWLVHAAIGLSELSSASLSLGRADQYLYPLFQRDLECGVSRVELRGSVRDLWRKLNRFGDPACAVNLGGAGGDGCDPFNELSALLVAVTKELRLPAPILAARIHERLPDDAFDAFVDPDLLTLGQPTFYGEEPCRETIVRRGVPREEAHRFALNSCMGLVMPGEEISDMWGAVINLLLPLELAANGGRPFQHALPVDLSTQPRPGQESFDELFAQVERYLDELVTLLIRRNWEATEHVGRDRPNPFLSALTRDCIARGQDRALGGARYHTVIVEGFGWANLADALTAVKQLAFDERRFTLRALVSAAQRDFAGDGEILSAIRQCPKYGNADPEADSMARRGAHSFAQCVRAHSHDNVHCAPSFHTLNAHVPAGKKLGASLDGRRAGEPLSKNVGPMLSRSTQGLTSVLLSASALDQTELSGGQALDVSVDSRTIGSLDGKRKFQALLRTYFARGGLQVQVNGVSADQLRAALAAPEAHGDLVVKIAGYSARFTSLGREVQEEMVLRFEQGL